jgi:hypothetical protein
VLDSRREALREGVHEVRKDGSGISIGKSLIDAHVWNLGRDEGSLFYWADIGYQTSMYSMIGKTYIRDRRARPFERIY